MASGVVRAEIAPVADGPPSRFNGPPINTNPWSRIVKKLDEKRQQTASSRHAVRLRVDILDGMWQFSEWGRSPLGEKLELLTHYLRQEFAAVEGLDGFDWEPCERSATFDSGGNMDANGPGRERGT